MSTATTPASGRATPMSLDRIGMFLSTACAIHCLLMPFALGFLAYAGANWVASEATELALISGACLVALLSLVPSYRKHRNPGALLLFAGGFGVILLAHLLAHEGHEHSETLLLQEGSLVFGGMMALGGVLIALAHYRNHRLCACCHPQHG